MTTAVQVVSDSDGNGIVDDWEVQYFGHIGVNPNADPDGDGFSNLQEYLAGTDPTDAISALRITAITVNDTNVVVSFTTSVGKLYEFQYNDDLGTLNWNAVLTDVPGTGDIVSRSITNSSAEFPNRFYRVRLQP